MSLEPARVVFDKNHNPVPVGVYPVQNQNTHNLIFSIFAAKNNNMMCVLRSLFVATSLLIGSSTGQIVYPATRFTPWTGLTGRSMFSAETLGYGESSWNNLGTNAIEALSFETINATDPGQSAAIIDLEMNEDTWDCFVVSTSRVHGA